MAKFIKKIASVNIRNSSLLDDFEILVGTHTGSVKRVESRRADPYGQRVSIRAEEGAKNCGVSCLYSDETFTNLLVGRADQLIQVYQGPILQDTIKTEEGHPIGLVKLDNNIVAGLSSGSVNIYNGNAVSKTIKTGAHLNTLKQCENKKELIAVGGKERTNNLKVINLESGSIVFTTKNVRNDYLELEVPIWDNGLDFVDENCLATCSRYGYVRFYDIRKQRRPVLEYKCPEKQVVPFSCMSVHDNIAYVGTTLGQALAFDLRSLRDKLHTYKGFSGSVSDIGLFENGKYLLTSSLDRFIRIHDSQKTALLYQCYVKSKPTKIMMRSIEPIAEEPKKVKKTKLSKLQKQIDMEDEEYDDLFNQMEEVVEQSDEPIKKKKKRLHS